MAVFAIATSVRACNVPVFRYALEHWTPDPYRVTLFYRGAFSDDEQALIEPLLTDGEATRINAVFRTVDVNNMSDDADRQLFESQGDLRLPGLVIEYPKHLRIIVPVRAVSLSPESVAGVIRSPIRDELIRRLASGQTAVWLLLESGQPEADDLMAARLEDELKKLEQKLKLPDLTDSPDDALLTGSRLRIEFSLLRVPRGDSAEQSLIAMLVNCEPDLADQSEAMLFPVFGRGRALLPLVGPGITTENLHSSAAFLVGPCSCQVKDMNPGFDLLLAAKWESLLTKGEAPPENSPSPSSDEPELVVIPSGAPRTPDTASDREAVSMPERTERPGYLPYVIVGSVLLAGAGWVAARANRSAHQGPFSP